MVKKEEFRFNNFIVEIKGDYVEIRTIQKEWVLRYKNTTVMYGIVVSGVKNDDLKDSLLVLITFLYRGCMIMPDNELIQEIEYLYDDFFKKLETNISDEAHNEILEDIRNDFEIENEFKEDEGN